MKQWLIIGALLLLLFVAGYFVMIKLVIPTSAKSFIPVKWQNIPLGEKRNTVYDYLGKPYDSTATRDHWEEKLGPQKKYLLDITYRNDSTAIIATVSYRVDLGWSSQESIVTSDTLK